MGYYVTMQICDLFITKENESKALQAINKLMTGKKTCGDHYAWVENPDKGSYDNLMAALDAWRYDSWLDVDGRIVVESFNGEKLGDCPILWTAIQKFVNPNAEIICTGEDGCIWKWVFKGGKFKEKQSKIVWED